MLDPPHWALVAKPQVFTSGPTPSRRSQVIPTTPPASPSWLPLTRHSRPCGAAPLMCVRVVPVLSRVKCLCPAPPPSHPAPTDGFTSEGEILEISDIQRGQAGEYECVTHNGVNSAPDSRRVLVTVNCETPHHPRHWHERGWRALGPRGGRVSLESGEGARQGTGGRPLSLHLARRTR